MTYSIKIDINYCKFLKSSPLPCSLYALKIYKHDTDDGEHKCEHLLFCHTLAEKQSRRKCDKGNCTGRRYRINNGRRKLCQSNHDENIAEHVADTNHGACKQVELIEHDASALLCHNKGNEEGCCECAENEKIVELNIDSLLENLQHCGAHTGAEHKGDKIFISLDAAALIADDEDG